MSEAPGWDADIIVMSFGWDSDQSFARFRQRLEQATRPPTRKLFFAAAANGGGNLARAYPARHQKVFVLADYVVTGRASRGIDIVRARGSGSEGGIVDFKCNSFSVSTIRQRK